MIKRAIIHILLIMIIVMDGLYSKNVRNAADFITEEYYCNCCHVKLEIIEENKKSSVQYKDETHIPKCPTCGSTDIKKISGISKATSVAPLGYIITKGQEAVAL